MQRAWLPKLLKQYKPNGLRNWGWPLNRLLDDIDQNGIEGGLTPWLLDDYETDGDKIILYFNAIKTIWLKRLCGIY